MSDALTIVITSAGVAAFISVVGAVVNGQLQRRQDLNLRRAEEARQLRDAKRDRLWSGLQILAEVAMGVQEANADLMRGPEYADEAKKRGDDLYALVEGHRAECVLGSREGRDLVLDVVGAIRRYQALAVDVKTDYSILAPVGPTTQKPLVDVNASTRSTTSSTGPPGMCSIVPGHCWTL